MKTKTYIIGIIIIVILFFLVTKFNVLDFEQEGENSSQTGLDVECTSSIDCPQVSIESYCQNNSAYRKLHDYSCIGGECVQKIKEPELIEVCLEKEECKEGICEPISMMIKSCGAYLTKKGGFYKLSDDINGDNLTEACITIMADEVTFDCDGKTITSDSNFSGVLSEENKDITIKNCEITMDDSRGIGIYLYNNEHSNLLNNKLNNQYTGLYLNWETNAIIKDNVIKSNENSGIFIEKGSGHEISNNIVCDNDVKDLKFIGVSDIQGIGNEFDIVDKTSGGWPVLDEHYSNCG